jgi:hypothetical protein
VVGQPLFPQRGQPDLLETEGGLDPAFQLRVHLGCQPPGIAFDGRGTALDPFSPL